MGAVVIQFPTSERMPARVAEEKIGVVVRYRYPVKAIGDPWEWLEGWLRQKEVLIGWEPIRDGLVRAFKGGRVRHVVSDVVPVDAENGERPEVEVACGMEVYPVANWEAGGTPKKTPAVLLGADQMHYFRPCKKCEAAIRKRGGR